MKRTAIVLAVLATLGLATGRLLRGAAAPAADVATYTVAKQHFVRRVTAEGNLRSVTSTALSAPRGDTAAGQMKIAWLAVDGTLVKAGDVVVRFDPSDPEKLLRDGQTDLAAATAKLAEADVKSRAAVAGRTTDAVLAVDELDRTRKFQSKDPLIFSRNQIIESGIDEELAAARQTHAERAKAIEQRLTRSNAAVIGVERQKAEMAIARAQTTLRAMDVAAPSAGLFVLARYWNGQMPKLGDSLWPGQVFAQLQVLDAMEANVYVLEVDGSGLAEGQPAEVVVEARPDRRFTGKIKIVDKLAQPRQQGSPVQYFGVVIKLDAMDADVMKPGQRVRAQLVLDQQDALVVPRQAVVKRGTDNVVYRRTAAAGFEPIVVEFGAATAGRIAITKGLADGDVIALRDPTHDHDARAGSGSDAPGATPEATP